MESIERTTCKVDGGYQVGLIWNDSIIDLPDNRAVAEKGLRLLEKRLENDPELNAKYRKTIDNHLQKGYIKKLSEQESSEPTTRALYLLHHAVIHPHKAGKVRRVCDVAFIQGTSHLSSGPDLLNSLVGILMRFAKS